MFILYDLYFDGIEDNDDDDQEHVGDFDAFSPGHSPNLSLFPSMAVDLVTRDDTPFAQSNFDVYILLLDPCLNARN